MKILALGSDTPGVATEQFAPYLKAEAAQVWQLYQGGVIREMYFRADRDDAVLLLECADADEAQRLLGTLPLVNQGLISFQYVPLKPYAGIARLFGSLHVDSIETQEVEP
ncbi:MAG: superoxide dismutase [Chloroflexi bacterium]|nr:superoxide dismutase [Chloroflexota bacterium]